jgi:glycosyltransferase involved in cell wall biosynthesis
MGDRNFKVSVAMCTHNAERLVEAQLESILNQMRPPDEIVICDDVSSDRTVEIIRRIGRNNPVLRLVQNPEKLGVRRNFENAVNQTTGDIIFLSNDDDVWFKDKIAVVAAAYAENSGVTMIASDAELIDESSRPLGFTLNGRREKSWVHAGMSADHFLKGIWVNGCVMSFRSVLKPLILPFAETWVFDRWIAALAYALGEVKMLDRPLMYYRRHGGNYRADPDLDSGLWGQVRMSWKWSSPAGYEVRYRRWEEMYERLMNFERQGFASARSERFINLRDLCKRYFQFELARARLKSMGRSRRALGAMRPLLRGDYHQYAYGVKSFIQDVIIP